MKFKYAGLVSTLFVGAALLLAGCEVENGLPTGASTLHSTAPRGGLSAPMTPFASEETDCPDLQEFKFRTSSPGSLKANVVEAWVKLVGAPADATGIRVWWHYNDDLGEFYPLSDLTVTMNEDGTMNVELMAEHTYLHITEETELRIRAELIVGKDGTHCARVRHITIAPPREDPPEEEEPGPCIFQSFGRSITILCQQSS